MQFSRWLKSHITSHITCVFVSHLVARYIQIKIVVFGEFVHYTLAILVPAKRLIKKSTAGDTAQCYCLSLRHGGRTHPDLNIYNTNK